MWLPAIAIPNAEELLEAYHNTPSPNLDVPPFDDTVDASSPFCESQLPAGRVFATRLQNGAIQARPLVPPLSRPIVTRLTAVHVSGPSIEWLAEIEGQEEPVTLSHSDVLRYAKDLLLETAPQVLAQRQ
jgi:hypothetical protein